MAQIVENTVNWMAEKMSNAEGYIVNDLLVGWSPSHIPDMFGKVALVTGANSGLGFETARKLAENGAQVFIASRDVKSGQQAAMKIREDVGKQARVDVLECDLSDFSNVAKAAREFKRASSKLDILINNSGIFHPGPYATTVDGIEQTLHVNYYAHALLTLLLLDTLRATPGSRVVFQSSEAEAFGKLNWANLTGDKYRDSGMTPYGTSKLYEMMFAREMSVRVPEVDFICTHPGLVATPLMVKASFRYITAVVIVTAAKFVGQTPYRGAYSLMYAATQPSLKGVHWCYIGPNKMDLFPTSMRNAANKPIYNPVSCWQLLEETARILQERAGPKLSGERINVPRHPDDVATPGRSTPINGTAAAMRA